VIILKRMLTMMSKIALDSSGSGTGSYEHDHKLLGSLNGWEAPDCNSVKNASAVSVTRYLQATITLNIQLVLLDLASGLIVGGTMARSSGTVVASPYNPHLGGQEDIHWATPEDADRSLAPRGMPAHFYHPPREFRARRTEVISSNRIPDIDFLCSPPQCSFW
jgi:hypothetical protein